MKRITLNITDEQFASLKEREHEFGITQSEQIRRALDSELIVRFELVLKKKERDARIRKLLEKEPELAVHFPGYLPEQKSSAERQLFPEQKANA